MKKFVQFVRHLAFPLLLSLLFVPGCQRDLALPEVEKKVQLSLSIEEAKTFFDKSIIPENTNSKRKRENIQNPNLDELLNSKEALWKEAYNTSLSNGADAVRVPLHINESIYWKFNDGIDSKVNANSLNYLFMYKDSTATIHTEWVTLMPDSTWLQGDRNNYVGKILIKTWDGGPIRLYDFIKGGKIDEFIARSSSVSNVNNVRTQVSFQTECYYVACTGRIGNDNSRVSGCSTVECQTIILEGAPTTGGWDPWGGTGNTSGNGTSGSGGTTGGSNYTPKCDPKLAPGTHVASNQLPACIPITPGGSINIKYPIAPVSYNSAELATIIQNLKDPITGNGVSLFLVENYRGSKAIQAVYQHVAGENIQVGQYTLAKNFDSNGKLISYYAWRNGTNGVEYMIKADQLTAFTQNIDYYTSAANLVYLDGIPSRGMISLMSGNYLDGLLTMWGEALRSPSYYIYAANVLVMSSTNLKPQNISYKNVTTGVSIPNYEITSHSYSQYMALIQQKQGGLWKTASITPKGNIQIMEIGEIKFTARPFASNSNYNLTIEYWRKGTHIGDFRFTK